MFTKMLQGQVPLENSFSFLIITGERHANHKLLLLSQISQVSVQNAGEVVNGVSLHGQVEDDLRATHVSAHVDFLLHDGLRPLLDVGVDGVAVDQAIVDLEGDSVLPPTVLDASVYKD